MLCISIFQTNHFNFYHSIIKTLCGGVNQSTKRFLGVIAALFPFIDSLHHLKKINALKSFF